MQGRAAAVYGLVFLLVAAGAFAYVTVAEPPEPSMDDPSITYSETGENRTIGDRTYRLDGFSSQREQPTATLIWVDENARTTEQWSDANGPGADTITYENSSYWVRIPESGGLESFTLLEAPGEDSNVTVMNGTDSEWIVNDGGNYTELQEYDGFDRVEIENGSMLTIGSGNDTRNARIDAISNSSVTVSWNQPAEEETLLRQTDRGTVDGQNVTANMPGDNTLEIATEEQAIDEYLEAHEDRQRVIERHDGLKLVSVLALVSLVVLLPLAFLPRKE